MQIEGARSNSTTTEYRPVEVKKEEVKKLDNGVARTKEETSETKNEVSDKILADAIEKANKKILGTNRQLEFSIHEKTNQIMVKVLDTETKEVIREIPSEKILDMVANMMEMAGLFVDEKR